MIGETEIILANRFGYGVRLGATGADQDLLAQLQYPRFEAPPPGPDMAARMEKIIAFNELRRSQDRDSDSYTRMRRSMITQIGEDMRRLLLRPTLSPDGFSERLFAFWIDHFTVSPNALIERYMLSNYFESAIRPYIARRFGDMLRAVVMHPSMIRYLDQGASVGPNSPNGRRRQQGLNENLAREVLELHTLGVDGPYTQNDVREFAELLTGLGIGPEGTRFFTNRAEPGAETVLGQTYGQGRPRVAAIEEFLADLAMKPATAQHLSRKLALHFIGPDHPKELVHDMADAYLANEGDLMAVYRVLLAHPEATSPLGQKVRPPFEYMVTCFRAIGVSEQTIADLSIRVLRKSIIESLESMGQPPFRPPGPDGWPEAPEAWITPPLLAARISWAGKLAQDAANHLDPRQLLEALLGGNAPAELSFAISAAEAKWEGVALLLVSPSLMRR